MNDNINNDSIEDDDYNNINNNNDNNINNNNENEIDLRILGDQFILKSPKTHKSPKHSKSPKIRAGTGTGRERRIETEMETGTEIPLQCSVKSGTR